MKPHYLGQLGWYNLALAGHRVYQAFDSMPYLVGSALERVDYRDVDVRVMLDDVDFAKRFPFQPADPRGKQNDPYWEFICATISEWMRARTGLPIDFQIQQMSAANATFNGKRNACGMFISQGDLQDAGRLCQHDWKDTSTDIGGDRTEVRCSKCCVVGERDEHTQTVYHPAT